MEPHRVEILLVEDNPHDADLALRTLRRRHLANTIQHLEDGEEALEFLRGEGRFAGRDTGDAPMVVLLDLQLPKLDGLEVVRQMKSDPRMKEIPIVVLTASREERDLDEAYRLGVTSYIVKPVEFDSFSAAVAQLGFHWELLIEPPPPAVR